MAKHTNKVVQPFDFAEALGLTPDQRMRISVDRTRQFLLAHSLWDIFSLPPVPDAGATEDELEMLAAKVGVPLPDEYRTFLAFSRYLIIHDGVQIWGLDHEGTTIGTPWMSTEHRKGVRYLVFGDYWRHADGDQLMFEVGDPTGAVVAYLHEHGPLYERFAPSFSLALWRLIREEEQWALEDKD